MHQHGKQTSALPSLGWQTPLPPSGSPSSAQRGGRGGGLVPVQTHTSSSDPAIPVIAAGFLRAIPRWTWGSSLRFGVAAGRVPSETGAGRLPTLPAALRRGPIALRRSTHFSRSHGTWPTRGLASPHPPINPGHERTPLHQDARAGQRLRRARRAQAADRDDRRARPAIADRSTGVGCDQLIVLEPRRAGADAHAHLQRRRRRGRGLRQCHALRRPLLMDGKPDGPWCSRPPAACIAATAAGDGRVSVDMGAGAFRLARNSAGLCDGHAASGSRKEPLEDPVAVNVGNPARGVLRRRRRRDRPRRGWAR